MPSQGFPDKVWLARNPDGSFAPGWLMASESHRYLDRVPYVPESRALEAEEQVDELDAKNTALAKALGEAQDRHQVLMPRLEQERARAAQALAALDEIANHPTAQRNPDGDEQAAASMALVAREHAERLRAEGQDR
jgi:hypothetical protein